MSEDIKIGVDASGAMRELGAIGKALEDLGRKTGLSNREMSKMGNAAEKAYGVFGASVARQISSQKSVTKSIQDSVVAERELWAAREASAKLGMAQNKSGRMYDTSTGRFLTPDNSAALQKETRLQAALAQTKAANLYHDQQAVTVTQRMSRESSNLSSLYQRLGRDQGEIVRQRERANRQAQLEEAFSGKLYRSANRNGAALSRLGVVMGQVPPATWARSLSAASGRIMEMGNSARYAMYDVAATFGIAGVAIAGFGIAAIGAAVTHERAFANVERTTQASTQGYEQLRRQLELMAMDIPASFEALTGVATAAGQLGISASGIAQFTAVVAKLSATTNLTADAAGTALARFKAFFSEASDPSLAVSEATFNNLASSILKVGVNSIATESGIVNVAIQIASMADYAGYTANQVVGLAGALSSIGVAPELARGTITRTFSLIGNAVSASGVQLEKFADLAGVSSAEFAEAWGGEKFSGVFTKLVQGIGNLKSEGRDANQVLQQLGFASVRDRPLLLRLAEAADEAGKSGGLLAQTMRDAEAGWIQNSELAVQYNKISRTTAARLQVLGQAFEQLGATMGRESANGLGELVGMLTEVVKGFEAMAQSDAGQWLSSFSLQAGIAVGGLLLLIAGAARTVAALQGIGTAAKIVADATATSMERMSARIRIAMIATGLIGAGIAIAGLVASFAMVGGSMNETGKAIEDVGGLMKAMELDAKSGASGLKFFGEESASTSASMKRDSEIANGMAKALHGVREGAEGGASGMSKLGNESSKVWGVFGPAARSFYKSQLEISDGFQEMFDSGKRWGETEFDNFRGRGLTLEEIGVTDDMVDVGRLIEQSMRGGVKAAEEYRRLLKETGIVEYESDGNLTAEAASLMTFSRHLENNFGNIGEKVKDAQRQTSALSVVSAQAFQEYADGAYGAVEMVGQLDEASQKAADKATTGMTKFVDTGKLIKLTQQSLSEDAESYGKAWEDAFGGAAFSLESYLGVFRGAAGEQSKFVENLQVLGTVGKVDASILQDLTEMGPEAHRLVQALVDDLNATGGAGLAEFTDLWGQTGYDSMMVFAVQAALGQGVIREVMATGGLDALREFNNALASGIGVNEALASLQRDVNGKPIVPDLKPPRGLTQHEKDLWASQNRLTTTARVMVTSIRTGDRLDLTGTDPLGRYATGGHVTGPGSGTSDSIPARLSNGEFVMTAKATRAIGVSNLYAMMRSAQGGRGAPRGRGGYAQGGVVSGGSSGGVQVVALSTEDRMLLRSIQPLLRIGNRDIAQAMSDSGFRSTREGM